MRTALPASLLLAALAASAGTPVVRAAPPPLREVVSKQALALLAAWVAAQNAADATAYLALYEPAKFKGVKRTRGGGVVAMSFAAWKADRVRGFRSHPVVAAERPEVSTWLDPGSRLAKGIVTIRFLQRWRGGNYADHGLKVLHLGRPRPGPWRILYEDLMNSEPGWGTPGAAASGDAALAIDSEQAAAAYLRERLRGANYQEVLAKLPAPPAARRLFARAIVKRGNFACTATVESEENGDTSEAWADLAPTVRFGDPCLAVRLVPWALAPGVLTLADWTELAPQLRPLLALPSFETAIPEAVMAGAAKLPEKIRLDWLAALVAGERKSLADANVAGLSPPALAKAYVELGLDEAALGLALPAAVDLVIKAASDDRLANATHLALVERLAGLPDAKVTAALQAMRGACNVEMAAIAALSARHVPGLLPARPASSDPDELGRALCLILNDKDTARQTAALAPFLPPRGHASASNLSDSGSFIEEVAPGRSELVGHVDGPTVKFARGQPVPSMLGLQGTLQSLACELISHKGSLKGAIVCEADHDGAALTVTLKRARKGGDFFLSDITQVTDNTCAH